MVEESFRGGRQEMDQYERDLNPDGLAGRNVDHQGPDYLRYGRTAYDDKALHDRLQGEGYGDDELRRVPILPEGARLEQGATYIDLMEHRPREFTATGDLEAGPGNAYVPKTAVDYPLWNRLIGVTNPERLDQADEP